MRMVKKRGLSEVENERRDLFRSSAPNQVTIDHGEDEDLAIDVS